MPRNDVETGGEKAPDEREQENRDDLLSQLRQLWKQLLSNDGDLDSLNQQINEIEIRLTAQGLSSYDIVYQRCAAALLVEDQEQPGVELAKDVLNNAQNVSKEILFNEARQIGLQLGIFYATEESSGAEPELAELQQRLSVAIEVLKQTLQIHVELSYLTGIPDVVHQRIFDGAAIREALVASGLSEIEIALLYFRAHPDANTRKSSFEAYSILLDEGKDALDGPFTKETMVQIMYEYDYPRPDWFESWLESRILDHCLAEYQQHCEQVYQTDTISDNAILRLGTLRSLLIAMGESPVELHTLEFKALLQNNLHRIEAALKEIHEQLAEFVLRGILTFQQAADIQAALESGQVQDEQK